MIEDMEQFYAFDFFGIANGRTLLVVLHLFGLSLGAGAAFFSDFLFTHILKDRKLNKDELGVLHLVSRVVWLGLAALIISGFLIFIGNTELLLNSSKFLAKMTIVGLLTINGLLFHFKHIPILDSFVDKDLKKNKKNAAALKPLFVSGALSGVSWASALVLGAVRGIEYSYVQIMSVYILLAILASLAAISVHRIYFPTK